MKPELAKFLVDSVEHCGNQEVEIRNDYSGRCMFGKTTVGVVVNSIPQLISDIVQYTRDLALNGEDINSLGEKIPDVDFCELRQDNMGMSVIIY